MSSASVGRNVVILGRRVCVGVVAKERCCGEEEVGVVYCGEETMRREGVRVGCGV
jgi:hypothetical protein